MKRVRTAGGLAYLALVEDVDHGATAHADLAVVLVDGTLGVANRWHVPRDKPLDFRLAVDGGPLLT